MTIENQETLIELRAARSELLRVLAENHTLTEKIVELNEAMVKAIGDDSVEGLKLIKPYWGS